MYLLRVSVVHQLSWLAGRNDAFGSHPEMG
jgi:hypothetical protein